MEEIRNQLTDEGLIDGGEFVIPVEMGGRQNSALVVNTESWTGGIINMDTREWNYKQVQFFPVEKKEHFLSIDSLKMIENSRLPFLYRAHFFQAFCGEKTGLYTFSYSEPIGTHRPVFAELIPPEYDSLVLWENNGNDQVLKGPPSSSYPLNGIYLFVLKKGEITSFATCQNMQSTISGKGYEITDIQAVADKSWPLKLKISNGEQYGYLFAGDDHNSTYIIPPIYDDIYLENEPRLKECYITVKDGKKGLISVSPRRWASVPPLVIEPVYKDITFEIVTVSTKDGFRATDPYRQITEYYVIADGRKGKISSSTVKWLDE
jgi:hypothetical protein